MEQDKIEVKEDYYSNGQLSAKYYYINGDKHGEQLEHVENDEFKIGLINE